MKPIEFNSNFAKIGMFVAADMPFFVYSAVNDHVPHGSEMNFRLHDSSPTESYFQHGRAPEKIHPFDRHVPRKPRPSGRGQVDKTRPREAQHK